MSDRPAVSGVSRMADNEKAILVNMSRPLTDDELRRLHDFLRHFDPRFTMRQASQ